MKENTDLKNFRMPRWDDLPMIPLYLDQILQLVDETVGKYLSPDGQRVLTKTMVNNYVKFGFIEAPVCKKYDKKAVASLLIITVLKSVYTVEEISLLIKEALDWHEMDRAYDTFSATLETAVCCVFSHKDMPMEPDPNDPRELFRNVCGSCAAKMYVRNVYLNEIKK